MLFEFLNLIEFCLSYSDFKILAVFRTLNFESRFTPVPDDLEGSYLAQRLVIYVQTTPGNFRQIGESETTSLTKGYALFVD